jgi:superfamily II DNA or RNA helicase
MYEKEWANLQDESIRIGKELTAEQKSVLEGIINNIVNSIHSNFIKIDDKVITKGDFKAYLLREFYSGNRLENIKWVTIEQYAAGLEMQQTITGKRQFIFRTEGGEEKKETAPPTYISPSQMNLMGEMTKKLTPIQKQKFFENVEKIEGLPKLYEYQQEAIEAIRKYKKLSIQLPTGMGKTVIGIAAIKEFGTPAIVIVPTTILLHQWVDEFKKYGIKATAIYGEEKKFGEISVITYQTARMEKYLPTLRMYRVVIFDEVHHLYGDITIRILYEIYDTAEYIIGLSATTKKEAEKGFKEQERFLPTEVEKYPVHFKGTEFEVPVNIVKVPVYLTPEEREEYEDATVTITKALRSIGPPDRWSKVAGDPQNPYSSLARGALKALQERRRVLSNAEGKLAKAVEIVKSEPDSQFLIFLESIAPAERLSALLSSEGITNALITAKTKNEDKFKYFDDFKNGKIRVLLSVFALEEGINLPDIDKAIWLSTSRETPRYIIQRLGRITRPKQGKVATLYWIYAVNTVEEERLEKHGRLL